MSSAYILQLIIYSTVLSIITIVPSASSCDPSLDACEGTWKIITDLNDPHVVEIAKFAVEEINDQHRTKPNPPILKLVKILQGATKGGDFASTYYRLRISAKDSTTMLLSGEAEDYEVLLMEIATKHFLVLKSFKQIIDDRS